MPWLIVLVRFSRCEVLAGAESKRSGAEAERSGAEAERSAAESTGKMGKSAQDQ